MLHVIWNVYCVLLILVVIQLDGLWCELKFCGSCCYLGGLLHNIGADRHAWNNKFCMTLQLFCIWFEIGMHFFNHSSMIFFIIQESWVLAELLPFSLTSLMRLPSLQIDVLDPFLDMFTLLWYFYQEYVQDGIDWAKVDFEDNQDCLNLFEKVCFLHKLH